MPHIRRADDHARDEQMAILIPHRDRTPGKSRGAHALLWPDGHTGFRSGSVGAEMRGLPGTDQTKTGHAGSRQLWHLTCWSQEAMK
jgi:hypothetical protein